MLRWEPGMAVSRFMSTRVVTGERPAIGKGSFKRGGLGGTAFLMYVGFFTLLPVALSVTFLPAAIELLLRFGIETRFPVRLVLTLAESAAIVLVYIRALRWQGRLLEARQQQILDIVTREID